MGRRPPGLLVFLLDHQKKPKIAKKMPDFSNASRPTAASASEASRRSNSEAASASSSPRVNASFQFPTRPWAMDPSITADLEAPKDPGALRGHADVTDNEILGHRNVL